MMHVGIANPRWRGKRSRHSRRMRELQCYVSGKRPMVLVYLVDHVYCQTNGDVVRQSSQGSHGIVCSGGLEKRTNLTNLSFKKPIWWHLQTKGYITWPFLMLTIQVSIYYCKVIETHSRNCKNCNFEFLLLIHFDILSTTNVLESPYLYVDFQTNHTSDEIAAIGHLRALENAIDICHVMGTIKPLGGCIPNLSQVAFKNLNDVLGRDIGWSLAFGSLSIIWIGSCVTTTTRRWVITCGVFFPKKLIATEVW